MADWSFIPFRKSALVCAVILLFTCLPVFGNECSKELTFHGTTILGHARDEFTTFKKTFPNLTITLYFAKGLKPTAQIKNNLESLSQVVQLLNKAGIKTPPEVKVLITPKSDPSAGHNVMAMAGTESTLVWVHEYMHTVLYASLAIQSPSFGRFIKGLDDDQLANYIRTMGLLEKSATLIESWEQAIQDHDHDKRRFFKAEIDKVQNEIDELQSLSVDIRQSIWSRLPVPYHELLCDLAARIFAGRDAYETYFKDSPARSFENDLTPDTWDIGDHHSPHHDLPFARRFIGDMMKNRDPWEVFKQVMDVSDSLVIARVENGNRWYTPLDQMNQQLIDALRPKLFWIVR